MDIFEAWREGAIRKLFIQDGYDPIEDADVFEPPVDGNWEGAIEEVDATIEALRGMLVGKPIPMRLNIWRSGGRLCTFLIDENSEIHAKWEGEKGTDGEEVAVLVIRTDGKRQEPRED